VSLIFLETGFTVLITGLERLLGWEHLPLFNRFGYVEMIKVFNGIFSLLQSHLPVYSYASFMVTSGEPRSIYEGMYMIGGHREG
jgi:hypothetical protein